MQSDRADNVSVRSGDASTATELAGQVRRQRLSTNDGRRRNVSECESAHSRDRWKRSTPMLVTDIYKEYPELRKHCTLISETYLRCFVKGAPLTRQTSLQDSFRIAFGWLWDSFRIALGEL